MKEKHPYGEYFPRKSRVMIIGSFPIAKFTHPSRKTEIKDHELDFFFGGERNFLWKLLAACFEVELNSKEQIVEFLEKNHIALGDVIKECTRRNGGSSDTDLIEIEWNHELLKKIKQHQIEKVFFTSKKVEAWFNKIFPDSLWLTKRTLLSPSGQAIRALYHHPDYAHWRISNPQSKSFEFILNEWKKTWREELGSLP